MRISGENRRREVPRGHGRGAGQVRHDQCAHEGPLRGRRQEGGVVQSGLRQVQHMAGQSGSKIR